MATEVTLLSGQSYTATDAKEIISLLGPDITIDGNNSPGDTYLVFGLAATINNPGSDTTFKFYLPSDPSTITVPPSVSLQGYQQEKWTFDLSVLTYIDSLAKLNMWHDSSLNAVVIDLDAYHVVIYSAQLSDVRSDIVLTTSSGGGSDGNGGNGNEADDGLSTGAIVGIAVGAGLLAVAVAVAVTVGIKKFRTKTVPPSPAKGDRHVV